MPAATIYESVESLAGHGLVERTQDRFDQRVAWLSLTVAGRQGLFDLLEQSAGFVRPVAGQLSAHDEA